MIISRMDTSVIVNLYFNLYPVLLMYDGNNVPIIPVAKIFDQVEPKVWKKLLLAFSKLITLIVNNRKLDDSLKTESDIVAFNAAYMFQSCLALTEKKDLPDVINHLLGNKAYSGGSRDDTGFDLNAAFEGTMEGGGGGNENASGTGLRNSHPADSLNRVATSLLQPVPLSTQVMYNQGVRFNNASSVIEHAQLAVEAVRQLTSARDEAQLIEDLSEQGPYSTPKLSGLLKTLNDNMDNDILKLERVSSELKKTNFNVKSINSSSIFSNIKGNPRLMRIVRLIDDVLKQNPVQSEMNKVKLVRRDLKNKLNRKVRDRIIIASVTAVTVVGAGVAYYATPSREPEPTPIPTPTQQVVESSIMAGAMAGARWLYNKGPIGVATNVARVSGVVARKSAIAIGSLAGSFMGEASGVSPVIRGVSSGLDNAVSLLSKHGEQLLTLGSAFGVGAATCFILPLRNEFLRAETNLLELEKDEQRVLSKFRDTFVTLMISTYKEQVYKEITGFHHAIINNRKELAMILRVSSIENLLESYEKQVDINIRKIGFNNLALLLSRSEYIRFQNDMMSLLESNKGLSVDIIKNFFDKLGAADEAFTQMRKVPLNATIGITEAIVNTSMIAGRIASAAVTTGVNVAAGAAVGGPAGAAAALLPAASAATGAISSGLTSAATGLASLRESRAAQQEHSRAAQQEHSRAAQRLPALQNRNPFVVQTEPHLSTNAELLAQALQTGDASLLPRPQDMAAAVAELANAGSRPSLPRYPQQSKRGGSRTRKLKKYKKLSRRRY